MKIIHKLLFYSHEVEAIVNVKLKASYNWTPNISQNLQEYLM